MNIIGSRLKETRISRNLTQKEVAEKLNITVGAISGYERGYREPNLSTLQELADLYNVWVDYLIGRTRSKTDWGEFDQQYDYSSVVEQVKAIENGKIDPDSLEYETAGELNDSISSYEGKLAQVALQVNLNKIHNKEVIFKLAGEKLSPKEHEALKLFLEGMEKLRNM